ncbi:MAG: hypothetical protein K0U78_15360 [Actinomycetia bacterium]|nr:hypothetical protein [Actinomycetes bacterium]
MKNLILAFTLLGSVPVLADPPDTNITQDTVQSNDAINAPTSVMQNTQVNSGVTHDAYGGGVSCARTTLQAGVIQSFNGVYDDPQVYVGFNMPLGDSDCDDAARGQISLTHQRTRALEEQVRRENESHEKEMKKLSLLYANLLAKTCMDWHGKVLAKRDSTMERECKTYSPTNIKHGHKEADSYDTENYNRVSDHSHGKDHSH